MQATFLGSLGSLAFGRAMVRGSLEVHTYESRQHDRWQDSYQRLLKMIG